jgi:hypothetical protein
MHFARNHDKQVVRIYLEEAKLPGGLILRLGDLPFVSKESFDKEQDFITAVVATAADNLDTTPPGVPASQPTTTDVALGGSLDGVPIYEGDGAYSFASFATSDREVVAPIAQVFHKAGLPIWYDSGQADSRSRSRALDRADYVLLFVSPTSLRSEQIQAELHAALDQHKSFIVIHLEEAWPPPGLALRLGDFQAILKYRLSEREFARELEQVISILRQKLHDQATPQQLDIFSDRGRRAQGKLAEMAPPRGVKVKQEGNRLLFFGYRRRFDCGPLLFSGIVTFISIISIMALSIKFFPPVVTCILALIGSILVVLVPIFVLSRQQKEPTKPELIVDKDSIQKQTGKHGYKVLAQTHQIDDFTTFRRATTEVDEQGMSTRITTFEVHIHLKNGNTVVLWEDFGQEQADYIVHRLINFYSRQDV